MAIVALDRFKELCSVLFRPLGGCADRAVTGQWLGRDEEVADLFPAVFVIVKGQLSRF